MTKLSLLFLLISIVSATKIDNLLSALSQQFKPKGELDCQLFGNAGCEVHCKLMCDLFYCEVSQPTCTSNKVCVCKEKYLMEDAASGHKTNEEFSALPLEDLLRYKFETSSISENLLQQMKQNQTPFRKLLQDPRKIGSLVRSDLLRKHQNCRRKPKWYEDVKALKPRARGTIHKYFVDLPEVDRKTRLSYRFKVEEFDKYVKEVARQLSTVSSKNVDKTVYAKGVSKFLRIVTNLEDFNNIMEYSNRIVSSSALERTINHRLELGHHELVELHLSILPKEDVPKSTEFTNYIDVPETRSLRYQPSDLDNVILINAVMELQKVYAPRPNAITWGVAQFHVKMSSASNGATVQAWSSSDLEGFVSRTENEQHYRKFWTNGSENLKISEDFLANVDLLWTNPGKQTEVNFSFRDGVGDVHQKWVIRENETEVTRKSSSKTQTFLWKTPDSEFRLTGKKNGKIELFCDNGPMKIHLSNEASSEERVQDWEFKNVRVHIVKNSSCRKTERWDFTDGAGSDVELSKTRVTNNADLYEKYEIDYYNFMLQFCEAVEDDYDACLI